MIITFTGPSHYFTMEQELAIKRRLDELSTELDIWRSGCAFGLDTMAARHASKGGALVLELYIPAAPHNVELVDELRGHARIIRCNKVKNPYRRRNEMMTRGDQKLNIVPANKLIAFVKSPLYYRSGEWMTINIARKAGIEIDLNVI